MKIIVPSFNRPMQLHCILEQLYKQWSPSEFNLDIIYQYDSKQFLDGYQLLYDRIRNKNNVNFVKETNFGENIKYSVRYAKGVAGFFTDDCIIYKPCIFDPYYIKSILNIDDILCISLRLGLNTIVQNYLTGEIQPELNNYKYTYNSTIKWNYQRCGQFTNYGYWFSWDGHFYSSEWLYDLIKDLSFENPRALEHQLNTKFRPNDRKYIVSQTESSVFVNTINVVQESGPPAGTKYNYTPAELNERYLGGEVIDISCFEGLTINSCHEEFPLTFRKF